MALLNCILPPPTQPTFDYEESEKETSGKSSSKQLVSLASTRIIPPYGAREGWIPRVNEDYGDGGTYPEVHVAQYPLELGRKKKTSSNAVPVQLDAQGND